MADLSGHAALMSLLLVFLCISYAQVHLHMTCIRSRREQNGLTADKMESMLDLPYEGVQKVRRLTQLTTRYAHHMLSLFNKDTCNWNALGPVFLQRSDTVVEELLFLVLQPAICCAIRTRMANTMGDGVVPKFWMAASAWADL